MRVSVLLMAVALGCGPVESSNGATTTSEGVFSVTRLPVTSFYKDTPDHPAEYWQSTFYLESDGSNVYVNNMRGPVLQIDNRGFYQGTVGGLGKGPGEYGTICFGITARDNSVVLMDDNRVIFYEDNRFVHQFTYKRPDHFHSTNPFLCRSFDVSDSVVVIPWADQAEPGFVATVYDHQGNPLETVIDEDVDVSMLRLSPWSQSTHWRHDNGFWYAAYMFTPRIAIYDEAFDKIGEITIASPATLGYERDFFATDRKNVTNPRRNIPLFFSFQVHEGTGWLMAQELLHRIDLTTGEVTGLYRFSAPGHPEIGDRPYYNFPYFAVLDDNRVVLATIYGSLDGELFTVQIPD